MELKNINLHLKQSIEGEHADALDLSPGEIAGFLQICHTALHAYICHANEQLGSDSEACISKKEIEKIESIFRELTDNFFPMAHSNKSLRQLQIVDKREYQQVIEDLLRLNSMGKDTLYLSNRLSESIGRLINP